MCKSILQLNAIGVCYVYFDCVSLLVAMFVLTTRFSMSCCAFEPPNDVETERIPPEREDAR